MADPSWPSNRVIEETILINAPPSKVISTLRDFPAYPSWSTFVESITPVDPAAPVGSKLTVSLVPPSGSGMKMTPTVVKNDDTGFGWLGHLGFNGVFDGKHLFLLSDEGGKTKVVQREEFAGFLYTPLMSWMGIEKSTRAGFAAFNEALKKRVEGA